MDTSRISFGEMVAAGSGIALLMFMSAFKWFTVANDPTGLGDRNAWETFTVIDLVLFLVALAAIGMAAARASGVDLRALLPAPPGLLVGTAGVLACALIVFRLVVTPDLKIEYPGVTGGVEAAGGVVHRAVGIFLGLVASAGIAFGGFTGMKERAAGKVPRR
jgi:hypothetical protein